MNQDIPPDARDRARVLFGDLIEGRWEKARREFSVSLRGQVDTDRFVYGWTAVAESAGSFERMGAPSGRQSGDYTVVDIPLTFEAGEAIGEVAFDRDGKVAGLVLEYPRRHRLDPRRVRCLVLRSPEITGLRHARL